MNLPDPAPHATPVAQAFTQASAMLNTFGTTTTEAARALQKWQTEYLRMLELRQPKPQPAPTTGTPLARALVAANYAETQQQKLAA